MEILAALYKFDAKAQLRSFDQLVPALRLMDCEGIIQSTTLPKVMQLIIYWVLLKCAIGLFFLLML